MKKTMTSVFTIIVAITALAACQRNDPAQTKGPAEQVGQKLDQAAVKATEGINKLAEKAGKGMEKAGENMQNAARDAQTKNGEK